MPEMTVSINAMLEGFPEIAIGNVIGSNIANILLVLGISVIISPIYLKSSYIKRDVFVLIFATLILCIFGFLGSINFVGGLFMISILASYVVYSYRQDKKIFSNTDIKNIESDLGIKNNPNLLVSILLCIFGILLLVAGSSLFLKGAVDLAQRFNISKEIIGLGIVAIGTCLPELTTAVVASIKKHGNIVIASIVGSSTFNILSIVGFMALIENINFSQHMLGFDLWVLLASTLILSYMLIAGKVFSRKLGFLFLLTYGIYFYILFN
ncbi:MAG: cation:H+ antiporter [Lentimonas sp.]|jgi:cation:H+ antiporter